MIDSLIINFLNSHMGSPAPQASTQNQQNLSKGFAPAAVGVARNVQVRRSAPQMSVADGINKVFATEAYQASKPETESKYSGSFVHDP